MMLPFFAIPPSLRKPLLAVASVAMLIGMWALWLHFHDRRIVKDHEASIALKVQQATQAATDAANSAQVEREVENAVSAQITKDAIQNAEQSYPEDALSPAGPVSRAAVDSLRHRAAKDRPAAH